MKTKIFSLILLLILTSCSSGTDKNKVTIDDNSGSSNIVVEDSENDNKDTVIVKSESWTIDDKKETTENKKITSYSELKELKPENKITIKWEIVTNKNSIDNIISTCNYLEWKNEFLLNNWKKEIKNGKSFIDLSKENLKEEKRLDELSDLEKLLSWNIQWKYKFIQSKNFDRTKFKNEREFYSYMGFYILSIKDEKEADSFIDLYLKELSKEKEIKDENYVLPLISSYYEHKKSCKSFIGDNFISY